MGYTTSFHGKFKLDRPLDTETLDLLNDIYTKRHVRPEDYNRPPQGVPGLWCQWRPTDEADAIEWDEGEKFYHYIEWIEWIIKEVLAPRKYFISGEVEWIGEEADDRGKIIIVDNVVMIWELKPTFVLRHR